MLWIENIVNCLKILIKYFSCNYLSSVIISVHSYNRIVQFYILMLRFEGIPSEQYSTHFIFFHKIPMSSDPYSRYLWGPMCICSCLFNDHKMSHSSLCFCWGLYSNQSLMQVWLHIEKPFSYLKLF